jgi:Flp pilus assembly protein TadG
MPRGAHLGARTRRFGRAEHGMVTVEAAIAIGAFVFVVLLGIAGVATVLEQVRCVDAAREAARVIARGQQGRAETVVDRVAPSGATLSVAPDGDAFTVSVRARAAGGLLPGITVTGRAYALREPGAGGVQVGG